MKLPTVLAVLAFAAVFILFIVLFGGTGGGCNDGWASPSIGRMGACSHHGGVNSTVWPLFAVILGLVAAGYVYVKAWDYGNPNRRFHCGRKLKTTPKGEYVRFLLTEDNAGNVAELAIGDSGVIEGLLNDLVIGRALASFPDQDSNRGKVNITWHELETGYENVHKVVKVSIPTKFKKPEDIDTVFFTVFRATHDLKPAPGADGEIITLNIECNRKTYHCSKF